MTEPAPAPRPLSRIPSGIAGLDTILHGGFFPDNAYIVAGMPGTGKTILGNQLCFHHVAAGGRALFITTMAESHGHMFNHLRSLTFFTPAPIAKQLSYLSIFAELDKGGLDAALAFLRGAIVEHQATLLVLDGWESMRLVAGSALAMKKFLHKFQIVLESTGCIAVLLTQNRPLRLEPERTMVDGIFRLSRRLVRQRPVRELIVLKFRGSPYLDGRHAVEITDAGLVVYPRIEALLGSEPQPAPERRVRLGFGIPRMDEMLAGGLLSGSTTLLLGSPGNGKTVSGLHFLAAGAPQGEPGLYFGFFETPPRVIAKGQGVGLAFEDLVRQGRIEVLWHSPLDAHIDALAQDLLAAVRRRGVRRLFIDGLDGFAQAAAYPERIAPFTTALSNELRALDVTTVVSLETDTFFGPMVRVPIPAISAIIDNLLFLRQVELRSQLYRLLSILKVRDSDYDSAIREFKITSQGIQIASTFESAEAILTGIARPLPAAAPAAPASPSPPLAPSS